MTGANVRLDEFLDRGNQITETVASTARICAQFLPKYELPPNTKTVILMALDSDTFQVDDVSTIPLTEIRVSFSLDWQQLSSDLAIPLYMVQKHAQEYCRLEDRLLLTGQVENPKEGSPQLEFLGKGADKPEASSSGVISRRVTILRGYVNNGLSSVEPEKLRPVKVPEVSRKRKEGYSDMEDYGDMEDYELGVPLSEIYTAIAKYHSDLEDRNVTGPWALVMGTKLFDASTRTEKGFVDSPRQRIETLLDTKVYRTGILPDLNAILMGGAATPNDLARSGVPLGPVDRAVSLEPQLRSFGLDNQGRYVFAIVGSLALRLRDQSAIVQIQFPKKKR
jgi:uncharacterized linocin/CFP29 family protein